MGDIQRTILLLLLPTGFVYGVLLLVKAVATIRARREAARPQGEAGRMDH